MIRSLLALISAALFAVAQADDRPNVIVFLVDDMGVMDTSLEGADEGFYETPNLEKLASQGMTFLNGYCAHPRCVESRFAIQTGRSPYRDAAQTSQTGPAMKPHPTIGEAFRDAGYATGFFGKWHLGKTEAEFPHGRGYETNIGGCHAGAVGSFFFPYHINPKTGQPGKEGPILGLEEGEPSEYVTDRLTDETETWIRQQVTKDPDRPFLAFLSHFAVHTPIEGKPEEIAYFEKKLPSLPEAAGENGYITADGSCKARRDHPVYASMVKSTDDSLGKIMTVLDELSIAENTIILFTSDHGGLSNRGPDSNRELATSNLPYRAGKGHLYDGGLRVPFLISYPAKVKGGTTSEEFAVGTDIFPTLLDLSEIDLITDHHVDGVSLVPALDGGELEREQYFWHHPLPRPTQTGDKAVSIYREGKFKLIKSYFPEIVYELYDLKADPYEQSDLASEKPSRVKQMAEILENQLVSAGAPDLRQDWKVKDVTAPVSTKTPKVGGAQQPKTNILFLAIDDLKPALGCYGDTTAITPNIDALAAKGIVLTNAHCQWPVCGPSRASLMTSLRPEAVGVMDLKTSMRAKDPNVITIPQHFKNHGYITAGTGKIYDPRCVDEKQSNDDPSWSIPFRHHKTSDVRHPDGKHVVAAPEVDEEALTDGQIAKNGRQLLQELAKQDTPFFLAVGFKKPHLPFVAPKKYWDLYDRDQLTLPEHKGGIENGSGNNLHESNEPRTYGGVPSEGPISTKLQLEMLHGYYACTSYIDYLIGTLVEELDKQGIANNTQIVLWGDHGFHTGDHNLWGKHTPLEQATRSPLIFVSPQQKAGVSSSTPIEFTDIFPTLCDLTGVPIPETIAGRSLVPVWNGEKDRIRNGALSLFARNGAFGYSYRTERYRYIEWVNKFGKTVATDLFDYQKDPSETRSLANEKLKANLAAKLRKEAHGAERLF
ncbi:MAG: sulfatase-like hydrolase/transferase [Verrucomicrobiota bacterium]